MLGNPGQSLQGIGDPVPIPHGDAQREAFANQQLGSGKIAVSQAQFARAIGVVPMRISHVVKGTRPVTAELALLFGRALGQSPEYWLNLQTAYALKIAEQSMGTRLRTVIELAPA